MIDRLADLTQKLSGQYFFTTPLLVLLNRANDGIGF
jgi:hypothetical protein